MLTRRDFLVTTGAAGALAATGAGSLAALAAGTADAATAPATNAEIGATLQSLGISHVVVAMMENRSFDHLLSWLPGANVRRDMAYPAPDGNVYPNYHLAPDYQGCGYSDQDHAWDTGWLVEDNEGALDYFLYPEWGQAANGGPNTFSIGYYNAEDIQCLAALAQNYTVLDNYYSAFAGETYPNRFYQHSGATDRDHNSGGSIPSKIPAIWDQLTATSTSVPYVSAGSGSTPTGAYCFKDVPFLALWGVTYAQFLRPYEGANSSVDFGPLDNTTKVEAEAINAVLQQSTAVGSAYASGLSFIEMATSGVLPNVTYIDPSFEDEGEGTSGDWHPLCDVRVGDAFIADIYHALADYGPAGPVGPDAPSWLDSTILVINFDEWGGFFDHVQPPHVTDETQTALVSHTDDVVGPQGQLYPDYTQLGFRVPCIVVSNFAPAQIVSTGPYDHTSVLAMIESIFGLHPIVPVGTTPLPAGAVGVTRDNFANNLGAVLSTTKRTDTPSIPTSGDIIAAGGPATGALAICDSGSETLSVAPTPIAKVTPAGQYGPATPPGVVSTGPSTALPESPLTVAVPLAAAALAGVAIHRRHRDGSVVVEGTGDPATDGTGSEGTAGD